MREKQPTTPPCQISRKQQQLSQRLAQAQDQKSEVIFFFAI
jgi:hypothetical protein